MRTLGIDIGNFSIKMVELEITFKSSRFIKEHEVFVPADQLSMVLLPETNVYIPSEWSLQIIDEFIKMLPKKPDRIASIIPLTLTTYRNIKIPSKDRRVLKAAILNEIDDDLPFVVSDAHLDFTILEQTKKFSLTHVSIVKKSYLTELVNRWDMITNSPNVLTTMSWCFREALIKCKVLIDLATPHMVVNIGAKNTELYLYYNNVPLLSRQMPYGTLLLESEIAEKFQVDLEVARKMIFEIGFDPENASLMDILRNAIRPIFNSVRQVNLLSKSITGYSVAQITFVGGGAMIPHLNTIASRKLKVTIRSFNPFDAVHANVVTDKMRFTVSACLALAVNNPVRLQVLNLRKKEFLKREFTDISFYQNYKTLTKKWLIACSVILSFVGLKYALLVYFNNILTPVLEKSLRDFYPDGSNKVLKKMSQQFSTHSKKILMDIESRKKSAFMEEPSSVPYLKVLKKLSNQISKRYSVDLISYRMEMVDEKKDSSYVVSLETRWSSEDEAAIRRVEDAMNSIYKNFKKETLKEDKRTILSTVGVVEGNGV